MNTLLDRFCRYVRIDTQADEKATTYPSSPGQLELGRLLVQELQAMGLRDAAQDEHGIVLATIPATAATPPRPSPGSPTSIRRRKPAATTSSRSSIATTTAATSSCPAIRPGAFASPTIRSLAALKGKTIITTDGTTLLGADDKAGVAVIMEAAAHLAAHPEVPHGPIRVCFTCDEEIGHGVDHVDLKKLGAHVGYTLDGGGRARSTAKPSPPTWPWSRSRGVNIHPVDRQGPHGQRRAPGRPVPRPAAAAGAVAGNDRPTARAFCIRTASRAASPR